MFADTERLPGAFGLAILIALVVFTVRACVPGARLGLVATTASGNGRSNQDASVTEAESFRMRILSEGARQRLTHSVRLLGSLCATFARRTPHALTHVTHPSG